MEAFVHHVAQRNPKTVKLVFDGRPTRQKAVEEHRRHSKRFAAFVAAKAEVESWRFMNKSRHQRLNKLSGAATVIDLATKLKVKEALEDAGFSVDIATG